MGIRKLGSLDDSDARPQEFSRGLDYLTDFPSKGVLQASVNELGVSNGGMFKCSGDQSKSWEEHSERQSRGTSPRRSEAQLMWSSLEDSSHVSRQFRNVTTCNPNFLYKMRCVVIRVVVKT